MKVLVDARLGWGSGIGRHIANTVPLVARMRPDIQFDAQVLPNDAGRAAEAFAGVPNLAVKPVDIAPFSLSEQLRLPATASGYDLTWFTNYWVPLAWSGRYVATVHDMLHLRNDLFPVSRIKRTLSYQTFSKLSRSADAILFVSRFSQREFEAQFGKPKRSRVQHNGIDHGGWPMFDPANPPPKQKRLLAVGASKSHKNFDTLLAAWQQARVGDAWTLTIISPDEKLRSSIDLQTMSAGAGKTRVLQGVSNEELRNLYAETAIMLTPSLYEGFGLPFMEAMQAGAFCITSTADSMVEIGEGAFAHFVNGRDVVGWVEAIERCCAMIDQGSFDLAAIQSHNMRHAMQFTWKAVAEVTVELLDDLLQ